jgi:2',3'-cyclic-nucleotide 2'-phosphodiesterase (5'-nucleotidase family)
MQKDGSTNRFKKNKNGISTDCLDKTIVSVKNTAGNTLDFGIFGATVEANKKPYIQYLDIYESAKRAQAELASLTDFCVGITHLSIQEDRKLAGMLPTVPLLMGGHEHENYREVNGNTVIAKADANAKTVYVHTIKYNKTTKKSQITSELIKIDGSIPDEPITAITVAKWEKIKSEALIAAGFNATAKVMDLKEPMDCRDTHVRSNQARVGRLVTGAMLDVAKNKPDVVLTNSGSFRMDDVLQGSVSELDIVRLLPFGGSIVEVEIKGNTLKKIMDASDLNLGTGGYMQVQHIQKEAGKWYINGGALNLSNTYKVIMPDFLLTGNESNLGFLKTEVSADGKASNPEILSISKPNPTDKTDLRNDIRLALIHYLKSI